VSRIHTNTECIVFLNSLGLTQMLLWIERSVDSSPHRASFTTAVPQHRNHDNIYTCNTQESNRTLTCCNMDFFNNSNLNMIKTGILKNVKRIIKTFYNLYGTMFFQPSLNHKFHKDKSSCMYRLGPFVMQVFLLIPHAGKLTDRLSID